METNSPTPPNTPLLELIDAAAFGVDAPQVVTVEGINWRVMAGDFWVVAGLPGSGKSDLLATAAGLQRPERGQHRMFGAETAELDEVELLRRRLKVGMVFEHGGRLFSHLTLAQNIALPLCYHQNRTEEGAGELVATMLGLIGLAAAADTLPGRLNRNARQRAALARALVLRPEILLLDNPLRGLDPRECRWWLDMLDRLAAGHPQLGGPPVTLVVATDNLRPWLDHGRQFGFLNQRGWTPLGDRAQVIGCEDPLVRDLLPI